jgi:hypothetical protein
MFGLLVMHFWGRKIQSFSMTQTHPNLIIFVYSIISSPVMSPFIITLYLSSKHLQDGEMMALIL